MFYDKFVRLCKEHGVSVAKACRDMGFGNSTSTRWRQNGSVPNGRNLAVIAQYFNVPIKDLLDFEQKNKATDYFSSLPGNVMPIPNMIDIPLVGTIACGAPITAEENIDGYIRVPASSNADFALTCKGDSMINARIMDGDIVFIRQQPDVENGEIAAVLIGDEATLKRVYKMENQIMLMAENTAYQPMVYSGEALNEVRILGKAVYFMSAVK